MIRISYIITLFACLSPGCSSNPHFLTPRITPVLNEAHLDISIQEVSASTYWTSNYGYGLGVEVKAIRDSSDYACNLDLELSDASKVCAALANSEFAGRWAFVRVMIFNNYGRISPRSKDVHGVADVLVKRDTLLMLSEKSAPSEEFQKHWVFLRGYKEQPDSKMLLEW